MKNPIISVLVPVYGTEKYIEKCARSLFEQTMKEIEFIFVNDCTKDNSIEILRNVVKEYPEIQCKIIEHDHNLGLAGARLTAFKAAQGDYYLCCDSDDWVELDHCEKLYQAAIENNADIVGCNFAEDWNNYQAIKRYAYKVETKEDVLNPKYIGGVYGSLCNKLIKASLFKDNNIYPWIGINAWEDSLMTIRLRLYSKKTISIDENSYHYNCHNAEALTKSYKLNIYKERLEGTQKLINFFEDRHTEDTQKLTDFMKVKAKMGLLFAESAEAVGIWKHYFPETRKLVWNFPNISLPVKVLAFSLSVLPTCLCVMILKLAHKVSNRRFGDWK